MKTRNTDVGFLPTQKELTKCLANEGESLPAPLVRVTPKQFATNKPVCYGWRKGKGQRYSIEFFAFDFSILA